MSKRLENIKGAIFDVDGTLMDSMPIWLDAGARYLIKLGKEPENDLGSVLWTMSIPEGLAYLKERYELPMTIQEVQEGFLATIRDFYFFEVPLKEGVKDLLEALHQQGIPMAIATSSDRSYLDRALERLEIAPYFRGIVTCEEAGAGKNSSSAVYDRAAELIGCAPEEIWVFEDVIHAVQTAKKAGYHVVGVYDKASDADWQNMKEEADVAVRSMEELL